MKKLLFLFIAFLTLSTLTYASFPVTEGNPNLIEESAILPLLEDGTTFYASNSTSTEVPIGRIDWGLLIWCYFLGIFGVHRFILGDTWIGIAQCLTFGGLYIWWIIDLVKILTGELHR